MCLRAYICIYVRMFILMSLCVYCRCMAEYMYIMYVSVYACVFPYVCSVFISVFGCVIQYVCMCMCLCFCMCMSVCMRVCIWLCVYCRCIDMFACGVCVCMGL